MISSLSYSPLIKTRWSAAHCSRVVCVRYRTERTQHESPLWYGGECHIQENFDLGPDFSVGSSALLSARGKGRYQDYESIQPRTLAGMCHGIRHSKKLVLSGGNVVCINGAHMPVSECHFIKMLWQTAPLFLNKGFFPSSGFDSTGVSAPFLYPTYTVVAPQACC